MPARRRRLLLLSMLIVIPRRGLRGRHRHQRRPRVRRAQQLRRGRLRRAPPPGRAPASASTPSTSTCRTTTSARPTPPGICCPRPSPNCRRLWMLRRAPRRRATRAPTSRSRTCASATATSRTRPGTTRSTRTAWRSALGEAAERRLPPGPVVQRDGRGELGGGRGGRAGGAGAAAEPDARRRTRRRRPIRTRRPIRNQTPDRIRRRIRTRRPEPDPNPGPGSDPRPDPTPGPDARHPGPIRRRDRNRARHRPRGPTGRPSPRIRAARPSARSSTSSSSSASCPTASARTAAASTVWPTSPGEPGMPEAWRVPTRLTHLFVRTLREDPADAEVASHRWLVRAGYIRRQAPGIFAWLPLGLKVRRKIETVIREEMEAAGAQEVHFPALLPREPYEESGRWESYGDGIFRLQDRKGADYLLAPTHEEVFTLLGEGPLQLLQGPAAVDLPDPGQVPRRGPPPRRPPARPRVLDEGQLQLRLHRRGPRRLVPGAPRRLRAHLHPPRTRVRDRRRRQRR